MENVNPTSRLAAQVENIDPDTLNTSPADAAALLALTKAMTTKRLATKANRTTVEDAAQVAALLACSLLAAWPEQPDHLAQVAALATYRASLAALEDQGSTKEDAADVLAADEDGTPLLRLALPTSPDPARSTRTTDRDRLALAVDLLADEDPAAADLLALSTYLPEDGRAWREGTPSAAPMLALLGRKDTGRNRAALARQIAAAVDQGTEAAEAALHHTATRTKRGADAATWTAHRRQVDQPTAEAGHGQYGRPRVTPRSGPASAVLHHMREGDTYLQVSPSPAVPLLPLPADLPEATILRQVDTFPAYGRTSTDKAGDDYAAASEPLGAVKKPSSRKRRRDGALGAPTVSGANRPRY